MATNIFRNFIDFFSGIFKDTQFAPFRIYTMDYLKTQDVKELVLEFHALFAMNDFEDKVEFVHYPVVNAEFGTNGMAKTEGFSFVLDVGIYFSPKMSKAEQDSKKQEIMNQISAVMRIKQNLYIEQQANLPCSFKNVRISNRGVYGTEKVINGLKFKLPFEEVRNTGLTAEYMVADNTNKAEYSPMSNEGTQPSTDVNPGFKT